eukprot:s2619_g7.t1
MRDEYLSLIQETKAIRPAKRADVREDVELVPGKLVTVAKARGKHKSEQSFTATWRRQRQILYHLRFRQIELIVVYVDDLMILAEADARKACIQRLQQEWTCSEPENVNTDTWGRLTCGFKLRWTQEEQRRLKIGQGEEPLEEENLWVEDARKAQAVVGELYCGYSFVRDRTSVLQYKQTGPAGHEEAKVGCSDRGSGLRLSQKDGGQVFDLWAV